MAHESASWFAADEDDPSFDPVEIVDEFAWTDAVDETEDRRVEGDRFLLLVHAVEQTACSFGAGAETVALVRALLGEARMEGTALQPAQLSTLAGGGIVAESSLGIARTDRFTRQVLAWQDILRGRSDDYAQCGAATLDEWAADLVARALGAASHEAIRRELRKRGVAAFGLVLAA